MEATGKISDASGDGDADEEDDACKSTLTGCTAVAVAISRVLSGADEAICSIGSSGGHGVVVHVLVVGVHRRVFL